MAISRMQEPQQIQSGIGSLQDPRQGYFLGKLVKKYNGRQWKMVAQGIGQRSAAACRMRWVGLCCPNKTKRACKYHHLPISNVKKRESSN